jgi:hypothetical protein
MHFHGPTSLASLASVSPVEASIFGTHFREFEAHISLEVQSLELWQ